MPRLRGCLMLALLLCLTACESSDTRLKLYAPSYQSLDTQALQEIVHERASFQLALVAGESGLSGLDALEQGRANLALVNNSRPFRKGMRAILPVHESVLHVLVSETLGSFALSDSLKGLEVFVANGSQSAMAVMLLLAQRQEIDAGEFDLVDEFNPQTTDLIVYFGPINPADTRWHRSGFSLVDLGGSTGAGVEYLLPRMRATEIPAQTYDVPGNEQTIQTLGVTTLLLTQKQTPEQAVFDLTETLIEQKPRFMSLAPSLFTAVSDEFDPLALNFPLHPGARRYLDRDEPSKLERYAELINLLVYLSILLVTGGLAAYRWRAHLKRDRIDDFYLRALMLRKQADGSNESDLIDQLNELEEEAFRSLISGKLGADESFRIFTDLIARSRQELAIRVHRVPLNEVFD